MQNEHVPVLAEAVLEGLAIDPNGTYLDATFGRGGHSELIVSQLSQQGALIVIDRDPSAIAAANRRFGADNRVKVVHAAFADLAAALDAVEPALLVDGVLFDLGVSSPQLDNAERGFSFMADGPLDMRMDPTAGESAAEWLAHVDEKHLVRVLREYGEERRARAIAAVIVKARDEAPIATTNQLVALVQQVNKPRPGQIHPATRTFQAIRIAVNDELKQIEAALQQASDRLRAGGRLVVISFHSLEDRLVKRFIRDAESVPAPYRGLPEIPAEYRPTLKRIGKLGRADELELSRNRRARSARLRVAERVAA